MRAPLAGATMALLTLCAAARVSAQAAPVSRTEIDALLATSDVDSVAAGLGSQFAAHVFDLVPDLTVQQREIIAEAVAEAFDPVSVREDIADALAASGTWQQVATVVAAHRSGALGELSRLEDSSPSQSLEEFTAALRTTPLPRERAQLVVALLEARGAGDLGLNIEEALQRAAHELVIALGATLSPFVPMSQANFDAVYRDRIRVQTIAFMHRYASASDDVIRRATEELSSDAGRWYVEGLMDAIRAATAAGGRRVAELTMAGPEPEATAPAAAAPAPASVTPVDPSLPCRALGCNLYTEWSGRQPPYNQSFGNAADLEARVFERLLTTGFNITRGRQATGITILLRPQVIMGRCDFMSGTDNRGCPAIGQVTVEFIGSTPGVQTPGGFTALNRCGDPTQIMGVNGVGAHVASSVAVALTTRPGERRELPRAPC
jgi:hypothetical protein